MKLNSRTSVLLDLVRGVSAQFVVIGHLLSFYKVYGYKESGQFVIQNLGVVIFFILSGFLITYSVSNKRSSYGFKEFFIDRFSRIYIAFIPALFVVYSLDAASAYLAGSSAFAKASDIKHFLGNMLMLQDFPLFRFLSQKLHLPNLKLTSFGSARPFWTVAVEWWMYLFFGFLLYKKVKISNIAALALLFMMPLFHVEGRGNGLSLLWFSGVLIFFLFKQENWKHLNAKWVMAFFALAAVGRLYFNHFQVYDLAFSLPVAFAFLCLLRSTQYEPGFLAVLDRFKVPAEKIAGYSFSLYLLHYSVIVFIMNLKLGIGKWQEMALCFVVCNLLAFLFARVTEYKHLALRNFLKNRLVQKPAVLVPVEKTA